MNDNEQITDALLHIRCAQARINISKVLSIYDYLLPRLKEAEVNLHKNNDSLEEMYYAFDVAEVVKAAGGPDCMHLYPRPPSGMTAWSGIYDRTLNNQAAELTYAERLALKMVNYIVYAECVYANLVNQLCYVLVNTRSPRCIGKLNRKESMESIARDCTLGGRVKFLEQNLRDVPNGTPDIIGACDIHLRNMIAHGSLAGSQPVAPYAHQPKSKYGDMAEPVYIRRPNGKNWEWDKKPVDLDAEYERMRNATLTWQTALLHYQDVTYESWKRFPES